MGFLKGFEALMKLVVSHMNEGENLFQYATPKEAWLNAVVSRAAQENVTVDGPLAVKLHFTKLEPDYYLRGELKYTLQQPCSRCAEAAKTPIDFRFELALSHVPGPRPTVTTEKLSEESEEVDVILFHGPELELDSLVEEQLYLSVPYSILCKPDCKGMCQVCGKNWNEGKCSCADKNVLTPFSVLKNLKGG